MKRSEWEKQYLKQAPASVETSSGIPLNLVYGPDGGEWPGAYPFTRGIYPSMYRGRTWTMRQYAGFGSAKESNERYKYLLSQGQKGLSVAFDLPTQMGYDPDHTMSLGEVGKVGVSICSLENMRTLFKDIPLKDVSTSMTINSTAGILLAFYLLVAKEQKADWKELNGTIQNDLLKEYIARGTYIYPPKASLKIITDIFQYCGERCPKWNTISISGYHIREAGSTAVQEVAFTLADGITYVQEAVKAGLDIDQFAGRLSFFFNVHNHFFEEAAKFRAARRLWAKIMKERFKAKNPQSWMLRFHSQTAGSTLTSLQPENNVVRVALQALSSVLGGTQSLHTNSKDEALGLPSKGAVTTALRTQQIIAHESGAADVADPLGGSHYVEALTDEIEKRASQLISEIEARGGVVKCIEEGWIQRQIQDAAFRAQKEIEEKEAIVVGVNEFTEEKDDKPVDILRVRPEVADEQIRHVKDLKHRRDQRKVQAALTALESAAREGRNVMPPIVEAASSLATLGEISDAMRRVFGEYREGVVI